MNKRCTRCEKVVYPIEELKCLDKVWHKGCFKCNECGMTLSMKTYKGFNKIPYCESHIPKVKATTVAETPETKRLAENTKIQSNVQYHAEFEKNKARFTQVADDPETLRLKQNSINISNVSYHGDLEKKAKMELRRDHDEKSEAPEQKREGNIREPTPAQASHVPAPQKTAPSSQYKSGSSKPHQQQYNRTHQPPQGSNNFYQDQSNAQFNYHAQPKYPQQVRPTHHHPPPQQYRQPHNNPISQAYSYQDSNRNVPAPYGARASSQTLIYSSQIGPVSECDPNIGSIADYDPLNNQYGSISGDGRYQTEPAYRQESNKGQKGPRDGPQLAGHNQHKSQHAHLKVNAPPTNLAHRCYRAIYDYEAADADEVSFKERDLIVNCTSIDEGWMTGTVQRSGRVGMLPANYVERVS